MADLGQWLSGAYSIPVEPVPEDTDPGQDDDAPKD
jgi:endogenous inhibitor of DNA gyrase (YacG/DUF329 family)